jgi:hypothetical protein
MSRPSPHASFLTLVAPFVPCLALAQGVSIEHQGVGCVVAGRFPRFDARLDPAADVARARLNFRPEGGAHWYYVEMKPEAGVFHAVLPKPQKILHRFSYYIDVTDRAFHATRTAEFAPEVASGPAACGREKVLAAGLSKANVLVHAPEGVAGVPALPAGFAADGVVTAGGTGTAAGTSAAIAGGIGAKAVILGTVLAAGGAGAVVAATSGGGGDAPSPPPTTLPPPTATGRWSGALIENDPVGQCTANWTVAMDLVESGGSLTGSMAVTAVSGTTGVYQCAVGITLGPNPLSDGTIAGTAVRWSFSFFYPQSTAATWNFDGVIAPDHRNMSGTWNQPDRPGEGGTWMATRQ